MDLVLHVPSMHHPHPLTQMHRGGILLHFSEFCRSICFLLLVSISHEFKQISHKTGRCGPQNHPCSQNCYQHQDWSDAKFTSSTTITHLQDEKRCLWYSCSPAARRGDLTKIYPKQLIADLDTGSNVELETRQFQPGIIEHFWRLKLVSKMAAIFQEYFEISIQSFLYFSYITSIYMFFRPRKLKMNFRKQ